MTTPKRPTNLNLDVQLRQRLEKFAKDTHRTLTGAIEMFITEGLDRHDAKYPHPGVVNENPE